MNCRRGATGADGGPAGAGYWFRVEPAPSLANRMS